MGANFQRNLDLLDHLTVVALDKGCTAAQLALSWVLSHGDDVVAIPGAETRQQLEENAVSSEIFLTSSELERIESIFPKGAAAGDRYPAEHMP